MDEQTRLENIVKWSSCSLKKQLVYFLDPCDKLNNCYLITLPENKNCDPDEKQFDYFFVSDDDMKRDILDTIIGVVQRFRNV